MPKLIYYDPIDVARLRMKGLSWRKIDAVYGVTGGVVYKWFKNNGYIVREQKTCVIEKLDSSG